MRNAVVLACLVTGLDAHADPLALGAGTAAVFGIGQAWYWRGGASASRDDWALPGTWSAIGAKLSGDGLRFDADGFDTNALKHPLFGTSVYLLARENRLTPAAAFGYASAVSLAWETFGEWREYASINDLLATSTSGAPIGEALFQVLHHPRQTQFELSLAAGTIETGRGASFDADATLDHAGGGESRLHVHVPFDRDGVRARDFLARSTVAGQIVARDGANHVFLGVATEFAYHLMLERPSDPTWDLFSAVRVGPTLAARWTDGAMTIRADLDAAGEFAMLRSFAFDAWRAAHPDTEVRGVLRNAHPYYYAAGVVAGPRLAVVYRGLEAGGRMAASLFTSLDGRDRYGVTGDLHLSDRETVGEGWLAYQLGAAVVRLDVRTRERTSTITATTVRYREHTTLASVGVRF